MSVIQIGTKPIYGNQWLRVREDRVRRQDGSEGIYSVVEREDFVVVVPFENGRVTLVEQYRYPISQRIWEFPMGTFEPDRHRDENDVAAAELREETGLIAERMFNAGVIFQGPGYCNQRGHVFLATGLSQGPTDRDHGEMDMITQSFDLSEFEEMIASNRLQDGMTIAAFGFLRLKKLI